MTPFPKEPKYVLCEIFMLCPEEKNASSVLGLNFFSSTYILLHNRVITVELHELEDRATKNVSKIFLWSIGETELLTDYYILFLFVTILGHWCQRRLMG